MEEFRRNPQIWVDVIMTCETSKNSVTICFEIFAKFSGMTAKNSKYARTQFYRTTSKKTAIEKRSKDEPKFTLENHKKYQTVSTLNANIPVPKFQKKGIIFIWPQRKRIYYSRHLISITWFLSHTFFWLHVINLFPSGTDLPFNQPPWNYSPPARKPERRDFIIEPDWDTKYK